MGDANENGEHNQITKFMIENGLVKFHQLLINVERNKLDHPRKHKEKFIVIVICTHGLNDYFPGCELTKWYDVTMNDHCGFLVDYEIERHFKCGLSEHDKPNHTMLNNEITTNVKKV